MAYTIETFDVCAPGFERMRNRNEFILAATINCDTEASSLLSEWLDDIQSCDRFDNFDYDEAKRVVTDYYSSVVAPLFAKRKNPFNLDADRTDIGMEFESESICAYLFISHCTMSEADGE